MIRRTAVHGRSRSGLWVLPFLALAGCELPPVQVQDSPGAYEGLGLHQMYGPERLADLAAGISEQDLQLVQAVDPDTLTGNWENVLVLDDLGPAGFTTLMTAITRWVSPQQGCNYCHVVEGDEANLASEDIYTKVVSRQMIRMTRDLNARFQDHVGENGITCYTCHRGNPNPLDERGQAAYWYFTDAYQPERRYLDRNDMLVQSTAAYPGLSNNRTSIKQTELTYLLMLKMSDALGVNCTYCHNSARFGVWEESLPARVVARRGLDMVQYLNNVWMQPLQPEWPAELLGPLGDGPKISCETCHAGLPQPLFGRVNAASFPALTADPGTVGEPADGSLLVPPPPEPEQQPIGTEIDPGAGTAGDAPADPPASAEDAPSGALR
jgi:photosynthetic reaction center cytochrome c subunit